MKKNVILMVAVAAMLFVSAGIRAEEEKREVSDFDKVSLAIPADMEISQGSVESLILSGSKSDLEKIVTKVENGNLKIYKKKGTSNLGDVKIALSIKELKDLSIAGSGDVKFITDFNTDDFELSIAGSGDVECNKISANKVEISVAGSGDVMMGGVTEDELEISIAGSGDVNASGLKCREVEVSIAGSGDARVWAEEMLDASIVGSGNVYYKGRPLVKSEATGSGSTQPL